MARKSFPKSEIKRRLSALRKSGGNVKEAATALGLSRTTFSSWCHSAPECKGMEIGTGVPRRVVAPLSPQSAKAAKLQKDAADTAKALQAERDLALEQLQRVRDAKRPEPIRVGKPNPPAKGEILRVIIPDSHGAHIARNAAAAFLSDLKQLNPHEIVMLGDHLDCGGFLAQHQTMGYVAETSTTYESDIMATNEFLDQIQKLAPRARIRYIEGNHEARVEKWCVTQALRNKRDAQFLLDAFGPVSLLKLKERGIDYIRACVRYDDLPVPGIIKLGACHFAHGTSFGVHATHDHVKKYGVSICHGHTHRAQSSIIRTVGSGTLGGWSPGCLAQLQPYYMATSPTDWSHGYGLQVVNKSGKFLHINVPILDGESLLLRGGSLLGKGI